MGLGLLSGNQGQPAPPVSDQALQERFGVHFPQLFAYTRSHLDDEARTGEIVVEAFCRAFARCPNVPDNEFRLALFGLARGLCRAALSPKSSADDLLSSREREVIALLFDARLNRGEIGRLLKVKEEAVATALVRGLRKLGAAPPAALAAHFGVT